MTTESNATIAFLALGLDGFVERVQVCDLVLQTAQFGANLIVDLLEPGGADRHAHGPGPACGGSSTGSQAYLQRRGQAISAPPLTVKP